MQKDRTYVCIDLKSFYASVECRDVNALLVCHDLALSCCHEIAMISVMECSL